MTYKTTSRRAGKTTTASQEAQRLINAQLRQIAAQQKEIELLRSKLALADALLNKARGLVSENLADWTASVPVPAGATLTHNGRTYVADLESSREVVTPAKSTLKPGFYNTNSDLRRNPDGSQSVKKDIYLERQLYVAGATKISEFIWEVK